MKTIFLVETIIFHLKIFINQKNSYNQGARSIMDIVVGIRHGDTSSNPGRVCLFFTKR